MVVLEIDVNGEKRNLYMDNKLHFQISEKIKPKIKKKDFDWLWIVDGMEGSGKSVLAMGLAKILDPTFNVERMCMSPTEFTKAILKARKAQCVVYDEAFTGLSSRASLTEINKLLVGLMMEMRQKNLFVIIVMPTIFLLDRYVALFRARGLFHVYLKDGKRGRWVYFNNKKKKLLYLKGKKLFSYKEPRSRFRGRFRDQYTIDEKVYRLKKREALEKKSRTTKAETYKMQRNTLLYYIYKEFKLTDKQISEALSGFKVKLARNTITEIRLEFQKALEKERIEDEIRKEAEEEEKEKTNSA